MIACLIVVAFFVAAVLCMPRSRAFIELQARATAPTIFDTHRDFQARYAAGRELVRAMEGHYGFNVEMASDFDELCDTTIPTSTTARLAMLPPPPPVPHVDEYATMLPMPMKKAA